MINQMTRSYRATTPAFEPRSGSDCATNHAAWRARAASRRRERLAPTWRLNSMLRVFSGAWAFTFESPAPWSIPLSQPVRPGAHSRFTTRMTSVSHAPSEEGDVLSSWPEGYFGGVNWSFNPIALFEHLCLLVRCRSLRGFARRLRSMIRRRTSIPLSLKPSRLTCTRLFMSGARPSTTFSRARLHGESLSEGKPCLGTRSRSFIALRHSGCHASRGSTLRGSDRLGGTRRR